MSQPKFYIVWNETRTEGFITNDPDDAETASTGFRSKFATSTVGEAFYEAYSDDGEPGDIELEVQVVDAAQLIDVREAGEGGMRIQAWHLQPGATNSNQGQWDTIEGEPKWTCHDHLYQVHPDDVAKWWARR